jgi:hypothetical protein
MVVDIGTNMDALTADEAAFYSDQMGAWHCRIVDMKYIAPKQIEFTKQQFALDWSSWFEESYAMGMDLEQETTSLIQPAFPVSEVSVDMG